MWIPLSNARAAYDSLRQRQEERSSSPILILASPECDSLCATHILADLLKNDSVPYKIKPVSGYEELKNACDQLWNPVAEEARAAAEEEEQENDAAEDDQAEEDEDARSSKRARIDKLKPLLNVVLINCGGIVDLWDYLAPPVELDVFFYVFDAHRPYDLHNVSTTRENVTIIHDAEDIPNLIDPTDPDLNEVDEEEEEDEMEDRNAWQALRQRRAMKRKQLASYYGGSSYGKSVAIVLYCIANELDRASNDLLWLAIVGMTDQLVHERTQQALYTAMVAGVAEENRKFNTSEEEEEEARRLAAEGNDKDSIVTMAKPGTIKDEYDLRLMLLRHWTLFESLLHTPYFATRAGIWKEKGREKFKDVFARIGVSFVTAETAYNFVDTDSKMLVENNFEIVAKDNLKIAPEEEIRVRTFSKQYTPTMKLSASDTVYAVVALLELPSNARLSAAAISNTISQTSAYSSSSSSSSSSTANAISAPSALSALADIDNFNWEKSFWRAYDALRENECKEIYQGLYLAIEVQKAVVRQVINVLSKQTVVRHGPFRYAVLEENPDTVLFLSRPLALSRMATFLCNCCVEGGGKSKLAKPFVLAAPIPEQRTYLVVGVAGTLASTNGHLIKNTFGQAFREAAERTKARIKHDGFETAVMLVGTEDWANFIEYLHTGLEAV